MHKSVGFILLFQVKQIHIFFHFLPVAKLPILALWNSYENLENKGHKELQLQATFLSTKQLLHYKCYHQAYIVKYWSLI